MRVRERVENIEPVAGPTSARALYISYDGLTSQIGQSQVLPYVTGLASKGHHMSVLRFEAPEEYERLGARVSADLVARGITWHPRRFRSRPPVVAKIVDQFDALWTAWRLVRRERFDIIHCRSYVAADVGLRLKRYLGTGFLFDMRGFWVDQRLDGGRWPLHHPFYGRLYRRWKRKEADFISGADEIVVLAEVARTEVESWPAWRGAPVTVIPCALDFGRFEIASSAEREEARRTLGIGLDASVLVYLGSLGTVYLLNEMLGFFQVWKRRDPSAIFLFVGKHDPEDLLAAARRAGVELQPEDLRIVRAQHDEVPYWLGAADLAICFVTPTFSSRGVSATKFGEYLAVGLPVVCNDGVGDMAAIVERFDAGCVLADFSPTTLERAAAGIEPYLGRPRGVLRERSRSLHDLKRANEVYDGIYRRMLGARVEA
jgi:glycosyltransferase involved in cell wall biosynthesis